MKSWILQRICEVSFALISEKSVALLLLTLDPLTRDEFRGRKKGERSRGGIASSIESTASPNVGTTRKEVPLKQMQGIGKEEDQAVKTLQVRGLSPTHRQ